MFNIPMKMQKKKKEKKERKKEKIATNIAILPPYTVCS